MISYSFVFSVQFIFSSKIYLEPLTNYQILQRKQRHWVGDQDGGQNCPVLEAIINSKECAKAILKNINVDYYDPGLIGLLQI